MSKEGSVAPKERINIKYRPATGDAKEDVELPLRLVFMGDYTLKQDETLLIDRELKDVNKDNFNAVMQSFDLSLDMSVRNTSGDDPNDRLPVKLAFRNLNDFSPDSVVQQVPELKKMIALRNALSALRGPMSNKIAFRKAIQSILRDEAASRALMEELNIESASE